MPGHSPLAHRRRRRYAALSMWAWFLGFLECGGSTPLWIFGWSCRLPIQKSKAVSSHRTPNRRNNRVRVSRGSFGPRSKRGSHVHATSLSHPHFAASWRRLTAGGVTSPVWSQQQQGPGLPAPRLLLLSPMGAKAGSTVEVVVTGRRCRRRQGPRLQSARRQNGTDRPRRRTATLRPNGDKAMAKRRASSSRSPFPPTCRSASTICAVSTPFGVSNPRAFVVGDLTKSWRQEPNNDVPRGPARRDGHAPSTASSARRPTSITTSSPARKASALSSAAWRPASTAGCRRRHELYRRDGTAARLQPRLPRQ